jgi:hypothetical protein
METKRRNITRHSSSLHFVPRDVASQRPLFHRYAYFSETIMNVKKWLIISLSALLLFGCSFGESEKAAETAADKLFLEVSKGPSEKYYDLYSDDFYKATSKEEWKKIRESLKQKLGDYVSHQLINWNVKSFNLETTTVLTYKVTYSKYEATETLTFKGGDQPKLVGHFINSKGLLL